MIVSLVRDTTLTTACFAALLQQVFPSRLQAKVICFPQFLSAVNYLFSSVHMFCFRLIFNFSTVLYSFRTYNCRDFSEFGKCQYQKH